MKEKRYVVVLNDNDLPILTIDYPEEVIERNKITEKAAELAHDYLFKDTNA